MVDAYRADVQRHLSFTECQQSLAGDVNALRRLWKFLHHWGVINFQADEAAGGTGPSFLATPGGAPSLGFSARAMSPTLASH